MIFSIQAKTTRRNVAMTERDYEFEFQYDNDGNFNLLIIDAKTGLPLMGEAHKEACKDILKHVMEGDI